MKAGKLQYRGTIQRPSGSVGSFGDKSDDWTDVVDRWFSIEPLSGREYWSAQQVGSDVTHKITLRYRGGIKTSWRFYIRGRIFYINSILNTGEQDKELVALCREAV